MSKTYKNRKTFTTGRIFDLDGTVIDSFHRVAPCLDEKGDLNLQKYIDEACTPEKVMRDSLMPLVGLMKQAIAAGELVIICTARHMLKQDYVFLRQNGIKTPLVCSRDTVAKYFPQSCANRIYKSGDADYKTAWFNLIKAMYPNAHFTMYDDHQGVLSAARNAGFTAVDAVVLNEALTFATESVIDDIFSEMMEDNEEYLDVLERCMLGA
ncbi:polynucleotide kinase [Vibrio phage D249]|nr:hypothetical protein SIPHO037v1_p0004 [Vibrio phage 70E35.2]QZI88633.1 hypothetical protein SIPHO039v1_p0004 [Vibrio phage 70E35.5a]